MFWYWNEQKPENGQRREHAATDILMDILTVIAAITIIVGAGWVSR